MSASTALGQETLPTWETPAVFTAGSFPFGIAADDAIGPDGDVDNLDGYPDVAVAVGQVSFIPADLPSQYTGDPGEIVIYQNTQDWSPATDGLTEFDRLYLPDDTIAAEVAWADITGDGRLDIVCTATHHYDENGSDGDWGIYVFAWDGQTSSFGDLPYQYVPSTYPLRGLTCADFDHDGDTDVVAAIDWPEVGGAGRDRVAVFDNLGGTAGSYTLDDESLTSQLGSDYEYPTAQVVAGKFDGTPGGNTYPDVFTPLYDLDACLLTGTSSGFSAAELSISGCDYGGAMGLAAGRFTLGKLSDDVAMATASGGVYVYHSNGGGGFGHNCDPNDEPNDIYFDGTCCGGSLPVYPYDIAVGHLNGGTKPDLVFSGPFSSYSYAYAWVLLGEGRGGFQWSDSDSDYQVPLDDGSGDVEYPVRVIIADMDQDGFGDVLTTNHGSDYTEGTMSVVINALTISP